MVELDGLAHIKTNKSKMYRKRRLRFFLILFVITLLAIVFFRSSFNRIMHLNITGNQYVSIEQIIQTSGIIIGEDYFFGMSKSQIKESLIQQIHAIQDVKIDRDFPGNVTLEISVQPNVAIEAVNSTTWNFVLADGTTWPIDHPKEINNLPIMTNWTQSDPNRYLLCKTLSEIDPLYMRSISEIIPTPSKAYPDKITMYLETPFEVITTISYLKNKITNLDAYLAKLKSSEIKQGIITMLEVDSYAPFEQ